MYPHFEYLELRIQDLEEENLQLRVELDDRPSCEDKQMDEIYIDELLAQVAHLKGHIQAVQTQLAKTQDVCQAQEAMIQDLWAATEYRQNQSIEIV